MTSHSWESTRKGLTGLCSVRAHGHEIIYGKKKKTLIVERVNGNRPGVG